MGYRVDIDHRRSRTIVREIGERLDGSLKPEPELPEGLKKANRPASRIGGAVTIDHSSG
jgi:hypothetical protein